MPIWQKLSLMWMPWSSLPHHRNTHSWAFKRSRLASTSSSKSHSRQPRPRPSWSLRQLVQRASCSCQATRWSTTQPYGSCATSCAHASSVMFYYLDCVRQNLGLYQPDVGVILDLAPHDISIANFVLGSQPTTVTAWGSRHVHPKYEDVAHLLLDYSHVGVRVSMHISWLSPQKVRRVTVVGSKQMAIFDDLAVDERVRLYEKAAVPPEESDGPLSRVAYHLGDVTSPFVPYAEPLAVQDQLFIDCITNGSWP